MTWTAISDDEAARNWDRDAQPLSGRSLVQAYGWGRYKARQGWTPRWWAARDEGGRPVAMVQSLIREFPGRTIVAWCPGGIVGPVTFWNRDLLERIHRETAARHLYCRTVFTRPKADADVEHLQSTGWVRPRRTVSAPIALVWELCDPNDRLLARLSANWRHNLNRALKRNLRVVQWTTPSPAVLGRLFEEMAEYKGMNRSFDADSLTALLRSLGGHTVVYGCENEEGVPLAVRGCAVYDDAAWDLLAATSPEGRRCYAAYAVFWALVQHCRTNGVKTYDLGGVDPTPAPGVYAFKRGTGAGEHECLGEWEWTTSALLARAVNAGVWLRPASVLA